MKKKKVQAKSKVVIKALSSYLDNLDKEDKALRVVGKRLNIPIDRLKDMHLFDANKMVLEYVKIQQKTSNCPSAIRHWITALVLHAIKQVGGEAPQNTPITQNLPTN